ncbi:comEA protein [Actinobaculum suis]|uniref:ComEA family DNA-binding protein n=1 Tax=Actinobaculum suis TaxID=1657 RepID=A0A1G7E751_9ACTO|nr:ComEA family DNA-binding protein [Actinobaculum suis]MDY5153215.1 ComEA family DNA-binding protein [Actinobaculum suis]SDE59507.1 comEA protein [Actinobaculum suis]
MSVPPPRSAPRPHTLDRSDISAAAIAETSAPAPAAGRRANSRRAELSRAESRRAESHRAGSRRAEFHAAGFRRAKTHRAESSLPAAVNTAAAANTAVLPNAVVGANTAAAANTAVLPNAAAAAETAAAARPDLDDTDQVRRGLASLALASGTGEDVAAIGVGGPKNRWRWEKPSLRAFVVVILGVLALLAAWVAGNAAAHSATAGNTGANESSLHTNSANSASKDSAGAAPAAGEGSTLETSVPEDIPATDSNASTAASSGENNAAGGSSGGSNTAGARGGGTGGEAVVVYVSGQVARPGVYSVPAGSRIIDAVDAAGGLTPEADPVATNLAAPVADGQHIHVLKPGETLPTGTSAGAGHANGREGAGATGSGNGTGNGGGGSGGPAGLVNLNTAAAAELETLPGVGPATARDILAWRENNGPFTRVEDLLEVSGIGPKKFEKLRDSVTV